MYRGLQSFPRWDSKSPLFGLQACLIVYLIHAAHTIKTTPFIYYESTGEPVMELKAETK